MSKREQYETWRQFRVSEGELSYTLDVFGDFLAKREGYKSVYGIEAVNFYLVQTHHWLPRDVNSMSAEDKRFALSEEMHGWTLPADAIFRAD